jgi:cystathionine beta-lyase family protein involved in aluminum resistance
MLPDVLTVGSENEERGSEVVETVKQSNRLIAEVFEWHGCRNVAISFEVEVLRIDNRVLIERVKTHANVIDVDRVVCVTISDRQRHGIHAIGGVLLLVRNVEAIELCFQDVCFSSYSFCFTHGYLMAAVSMWAIENRGYFKS